MINLKDFKSNVDGKNFIMFNIKETKFSLKELLDGFDSFKMFMNTYNVSLDWLIKAIENDPQINVNDLFDYTISKTPFLSDKNGVYTRKLINEGGNLHEEITHYDVYVTISQFYGLIFNRLARMAMKFHFPALFEKPFTFKARKYSEKVHEIKMDTLIKNVNKLLSCDFDYDDIMVSDLIDIMNGNGDAMIDKSMFAIYGNDGNHIFLHLDQTKDYDSLYLRPSDFFNGDWDAVKNRNVYSIKNGKDENGNTKWFNGKQMDAPYFDETHPLIKAVKDIIINARKEN